MTVVVFDAWHPDDAALLNSHQVAEWTAERLTPDVRVLDGEAVTRGTVADAMADPATTGGVFCGHGSDRALWSVAGAATRESVLDLQNLADVGLHWFHAFACLSGNGLALSAAREGVAAYAGYNVKVVVEFTTETLPPELAALLRTAVTVTTVQLHQGQRSRRALRLEVRAATRRLRQWLLDHQSMCLRRMSRTEWIGLQTLATLLHDSLELEGVQVED